VISAFARIARPIILRYFNRRSCIASSRIAVEVFRQFGIESSPISVRFVLRAPSLNVAFVSGLTSQQQAEVSTHAERFVALPLGPDIGGGGRGWNGHVILKAGDALVDPSFDQALDALAGNGAPIESAPRVAVFPLNGLQIPQDFHVRFTAILDDNTEIVAEYDALHDESFRDAPAWETDHLEPAIEEIVTAMIWANGWDIETAARSSGAGK
jgi:hypothetical protein